MMKEVITLLSTSETKKKKETGKSPISWKEQAPLFSAMMKEDTILKNTLI